MLPVTPPLPQFEISFGNKTLCVLSRSKPSLKTLLRVFPPLSTTVQGFFTLHQPFCMPRWPAAPLTAEHALGFPL